MWSVGQSVTLVNPAKTDELIEMSFGLSTRVHPRNHLLDAGPNPPMGRGNFEGGKGWPIVKYSDTLQSSVQKWLNGSWCHLGYWLWLAQGIIALMGVQIPPWEWAIFGEKSPIVKHRDFLPWAVQKQLNRSICRLGCRLGWAEGSTSSFIFTRWRQCAQFWSYSAGGANLPSHAPMRPSAAVMQSYVKLFWPLIMAALCNCGAIIFLPCSFFLSSIFLSSPNLSGHRLDVYHTMTHGVALVRI